MRGKNKCKILKEIRQKIADENDIPYVTQECSYQGECSGTCPRCEAELRYLEQQLEKRQRLGKTVTVAALSASLMLGLTACPNNVKEGEVPLRTEPFSQESSDPYDTLVQGTIATSETDPIVVGEVPNTTDECVIELEGDVAYVEPSNAEDIVAGWPDDVIEFEGAPTTEEYETAGAPPYEPNE